MDGSEASAPQVGEEKREKTFTSLLRGMIDLNVASSETCALLIRCGRVKVNSEVVTDERARINRFEDRISVTDRMMGTVVRGAGRDEVSELEERSPRSQRDRSLDSEEDVQWRRSGRNVDGGFYSSRKRRYGK